MNEPRSRPRTLAVTTTRRLPSSRLIWLGPITTSTLATSSTGTNPRGPSLVAGNGTRNRPIWSTFARMSSGSRTTTGKRRSEEHTSELQSLMRNSYAVFCLKKTRHCKQQEDTLIYSKQEKGTYNVYTTTTH